MIWTVDLDRVKDVSLLCPTVSHARLPDSRERSSTPVGKHPLRLKQTLTK
jgi:hypothetical protein